MPLVVVRQDAFQAHRLHAGEVNIGLSLAGVGEIEQNFSPHLGQIAARHEAIAAVVARTNQNEDALGGRAIGLLDGFGHAAPSAFHHLGVAVSRVIGRFFGRFYFGNGVDVHGERGMWNGKCGM